VNDIQWVARENWDHVNTYICSECSNPPLGTGCTVLLILASYVGGLRCVRLSLNSPSVAISSTQY